MKTKLLMLFVFSLCVSGLAAQNSLQERIASVKSALIENPAPSGFTWEHFEEINAAFLKPVGWTVSKKASGKFFISAPSLEDPKTEGKFQHGLTVLAGKLGDKEESVLEFLRGKRDGLLEENYEMRRNDIDFGTLKGFNCLYVLEKYQIGVFVLFVGNPITNSFYQITFESPVTDFDKYWEDFGNDMVDSFVVDDEV